MTHPTSIDLHRGSKVFALSEEVGQVVDIGPNDIDVQKGQLRKHIYRVPQSHIVEASDGVVDLDIDRERVEAFEVGRPESHPAGDLPDDLPEEYLRWEYGERRPDPPDPPVR